MNIFFLVEITTCACIKQMKLLTNIPFFVVKNKIKIQTGNIVLYFDKIILIYKSTGCEQGLKNNKHYRPIFPSRPDLKIFHID